MTAEHDLEQEYTMWFRWKNKQGSSFESSMTEVGNFSTVEEFWGLYSWMKRPSELKPSDISIFRSDIKPLWEDEANAGGGTWIIRLKKPLASRVWECLILAMIGEQFMVGPEICGAKCSIRWNEVILSLWNKSADDQSTCYRIRDTLKRVLQLPPNVRLEYKAHAESLRDRSSYQYTHVITD